MEKKRITSVKTKISSITRGKYVPQEGFSPSYVLSGIGQRLSRVRVCATVVDKFLSDTGKFAAVTLDDGTDTIRAKVFNAVSMFENISAGNVVDVIARVKEYNGEIYLVPEIITKTNDPNFELLRELEIKNVEKIMRKKREVVMSYKSQTADVSELSRLLKERENIDEDETESILQTQSMEEAPKEEVNNKDVVLGLIEKLDTGQGCDYSELLEASKLPEETIDSVVNELLSDGVCFEPKPGKIKKL
jgi:RPA family protein